MLDASALILSLVGKTRQADLIRARITAGQRHSPHLIDAELGNVLRRHERAGLISAEEAQTALLLGPALVDYRYPHTDRLAERAWELRDSLSFYDALYVALATELDLPLLTVDRRIGRAPRLPCRVELFGEVA